MSKLDREPRSGSNVQLNGQGSCSYGIPAQAATSFPMKRSPAQKRNFAETPDMTTERLRKVADATPIPDCWPSTFPRR